MKRDTDQTTKQFPATPVEVEDAIRRWAYESYEQRGRADGFELDDWAQAEVKYWVPGKCHSPGGGEIQAQELGDMSNRLIVVSNRLPLTLRKADGHWTTERSSGGLASAMNPILRRNGGDWIGWAGASGEEDQEERRSVLEDWAQKEQCFAVELPEEIATGFYEGYSNQTLWPVFHNFPSQLKFDAKDWQAYVEANRIFSKAIVERYKPDDLVWVHDYQLMLLPQMLRDELPDAAIGFFLHIPFPSSEIFPILPRREELLQGLLGADLVAFQTHGHLQQFRSALLRVLGIESKVTELAVDARPVRLEALPIGIAPDEYADLLSKDEATARYHAELITRYTGRRVLLAVDRLDYTKGIPERLRAYALLLRSSSDFREKVVLIQIAVPTREGIDTYQDLRTEVNRLVGEINGKLGTPNWTPVVYINRSIERAELAALYKLADVCWVGSLRDGMNLVAKEYVACKAEGDGVLVLSEFAGAAAEMGEALLINPFDEERTASTVERALALDEDERRQRMKTLHARVLRNNVFRWGDRFLTSLQEAVSERGRYVDTQPQRLRPAEAQQAYMSAQRRLLALDYDGTLVPFTDHPHQAAPPRVKPADRPCPRVEELRGSDVRQASGRPGSLVRCDWQHVACGGARRRTQATWIIVGALAVASSHGLEVHSNADFGALC